MNLIVRQFLNEKEKRYQQELFQAIDKNCDGKISKTELFEGCIKVFGKQLSSEQIDDMFYKVDMDNSGQIDYHEFLLATINESVLLSEINLKELFEFMDRDKDQLVSIDEIKSMLDGEREIPTSQWDSMLSLIDLAKDEKICFEKFFIMMKKI